MSSQLTISKSVISSPNVSGDLQTNLFNSLFGVSRRTHTYRPSTRGSGEVDFTLLLSQWLGLSLFYGCRQKKRDLVQRQRSLISTADSMSFSMLIPVPAPQVLQECNGGPDDMPVHTLDCMTGKGHWALGTCCFMTSGEQACSLSCKESLRIAHCNPEPEKWPR